jgi:hypothetical protein
VISSRGALIDLEAQDLTADERTVGAIEVEQRYRLVVSARLQVGVEEAHRQVRTAETIEVHREKRDLAGDVAVPESVVELDAVEDLDRLGTAHVLRLQISVAIADAAGRDPRREARRLALHEGLHPDP